MALSCRQLLEKYSQAWQEATVHPFLAQCKLGAIQPQEFNTWLEQDYLFIIDFTRMVGRVLAIAPPEHFDVLLGELCALKDELNWFTAKASERNLYLNTKKQLNCLTYCDYLDNLATMPYTVQATALWAIEVADNQAWQLLAEMPELYAEFAQRWGNNGFTNYVELLEQQADTALQTASETIQQQAEQAFLNIAKLKKEFWQTAFNAE